VNDGELRQPRLNGVVARRFMENSDNSVLNRTESDTPLFKFCRERCRTFGYGEREDHVRAVRKRRVAIRLVERIAPSIELGFERHDFTGDRDRHDVRSPCPVVEFLRDVWGGQDCEVLSGDQGVYEVTHQGSLATVLLD